MKLPKKRKLALAILILFGTAATWIVIDFYNLTSVANVSSPGSGGYTRSLQLPLGAKVQSLTGEASFPSLSVVISQTAFLVGGQVLGINDTTLQWIGSPSKIPYVVTIFAFRINFSLIGNLQSDRIILVRQEGGIAEVNSTNYINETVAGWQPLKINGRYLLALFPANNGSSEIAGGPDGTFTLLPNYQIVISGDLQGENPNITYPVSPSEFLQLWDSVPTTITSSGSASISTSSGPTTNVTASVSSTSRG